MQSRRLNTDIFLSSNVLFIAPAPTRMSGRGHRPSSANSRLRPQRTHARTWGTSRRTWCPFETRKSGSWSKGRERQAKRRAAPPFAYGDDRWPHVSGPLCGQLLGPPRSPTRGLCPSDGQRAHPNQQSRVADRGASRRIPYFSSAPCPGPPWTLFYQNFKNTLQPFCCCVKHFAEGTGLEPVRDFSRWFSKPVPYH